MSIINPDTTTRPILVLAERYQAGQGHWHKHQRAQLIHASEGVLTVRTATGMWVVPPQRAVWVLPQVMHQVSANREFLLRTIYIEPSLIDLPSTCRVVAVEPLLEALLNAAYEFGGEYPTNGAEQRLMNVILDRLPLQELANTYLPQASDPRLQKLTKMLESDPAEGRTLAQLAAPCGITERTAARLFIKETGLSFGQWRQQFRLLTALGYLEQGQRVGNVALDVGYSDVSAFISAFKQAFGDTPARYFKAE
jgi:AraC-like DNA-binding protein